MSWEACLEPWGSNLGRMEGCKRDKCLTLNSAFTEESGRSPGWNSWQRGKVQDLLKGYEVWYRQVKEHAGK